MGQELIYLYNRERRLGKKPKDIPKRIAGAISEEISGRISEGIPQEYLIEWPKESLMETQGIFICKEIPRDIPKGIS